MEEALLSAAEVQPTDGTAQSLCLEHLALVSSWVFNSEVVFSGRKAGRDLKGTDTLREVSQDLCPQLFSSSSLCFLMEGREHATMRLCSELRGLSEVSLKKLPMAGE